jgi:hypothetical protein
MMIPLEQCLLSFEIKNKTLMVPVDIGRTRTVEAVRAIMAFYL